MVNGIAAHLLKVPANETEAARSERLRGVTREFETIFLETILRQMRTSTRSTSGNKVGLARETYEGWQDQQFARSISAGSGIGLAEMLYRQLQEAHRNQGM